MREGGARTHAMHGRMAVVERERERERERHRERDRETERETERQRERERERDRERERAYRVFTKLLERLQQQPVAPSPLNGNG